jgi:hypothetical protein
VEEDDIECKSKDDWCSEHKTRQECEDSCHYATGIGHRYTVDA